MKKIVLKMAALALLEDIANGQIRRALETPGPTEETPGPTEQSVPSPCLSIQK
jgi:hypothetical protein